MTTDSTLARRTAGRPELTHRPLALPLLLAGHRAADGHTLDAYVTLAVRLLDTPADLELFNEQLFFGRDKVTIDDVRQRLLGPLGTSFGEFVAGHDIDTCLRQHAAVSTLLLQRCEAVGFGCGLAFTLTDLRLDSPTRQREHDRHDADARRLEHVEAARRLATQLETLPPAAVTVMDRPAMLTARFRAAAVRPWRAVLTAGRNVLTLTAADDLKVIAMPNSIGSVRSVSRPGPDAAEPYAVGGQGGVCLLNARFEPVREFATTPLGRGFNSIVRLRDTGEIVAAHGETGLTVWSADDVARVLTPPGPARLLTRIADHVLLAVNGQAYALVGDVCRPVGRDGAAVLALLDLGTALGIARQDGAIDRLDRVTLAPRDPLDTGVPRTAAAAFGADDVTVALLDGPRGVDAVDEFGVTLARFNTRPARLRMLACAGGHLIGVSADRSTVTVWDAAAPREPVLAVNVLARIGNHVTDLIAEDHF